MATNATCPEIDFNKTIYHVWKVADGGNAMFRKRRNFRTRQAAQAWLDRNGFSKKQMKGDMKIGVVLACKPEERYYCGCSKIQGKGRVNQHC